MVPIVKLLSLASAKQCGSGLESNEHTELTCIKYDTVDSC